MKSKLFTPAPAGENCALDKEETLYTFVNPPTHADLPTFEGNTGMMHYGLSLNGSGNEITPKPKGRAFRAVSEKE